MITGSQDAWTFRIVDQDTGAAVPGVPVSVLGEGSHEGGYWVSDRDGVVRIPKHDRARLRLRVGLRNEEMIELDARSLPDDPIPLAAPRDRPLVTPTRPRVEDAPAAALAAPASAATRGHVIRFARVALLPQDRDITAAPDEHSEIRVTSPELPAVRYGVLLELEQVWQSLGSQSGDTLYSVSLGPGEEVKLVVSDGRWRKKPDASERHLQIVAKMVGSRQLGDNMEVIPLDPFISADLGTAASATVQFLAERTGRSGEALQRRPLGITELSGGGDPPPGTSLRTLRNLRAEGVLTYHVVEPVERYRVIVRAPRLFPAMLVPFRLPNIATRDVVRRFGYAIRRSLLDRTLGPAVEEVLSAATPSAAAERRVYEHIAAHLPYYSATIIAAGDPAERFFSLAKLRDPQGRPLTDVIQNVVVGRVGNYVAFLLRSTEFTTPEWRTALGAAGKAAVARESQDQTVTLPLPGIWLRSELFPAEVASTRDGAADPETPEARTGRTPRRRSSDR